MEIHWGSETAGADGTIPHERKCTLSSSVDEIANFSVQSYNKCRHRADAEKIAMGRHDALNSLVVCPLRAVKGGDIECQPGLLAC